MDARGDPPRGLRVLITNRILLTRTGTEVYVRDLAASLLRRGHLPIVYSPHLGEMAAEIRAGTVPVVDDLSAVGAAPDIIHGHHGLETLAALLAFPGVPAIAVCHSWLGWPDAPVLFPRIARHLAVDHTCRDRLVFEHGLPEGRVHVRLNAIDLAQFQPRGPLPAKPVRALVFGNSAGGGYLQAIQQACAAHGIAVDVAGYRAGTVLGRPQDVLGGYDLVFAKGKAALEAAAVGAAVVLADVSGIGPMVTTQNFAELRPLNFGIRTLRHEASVEVIAREVARYDAADAAAVSRRVRETAGHETLVDELLDLYAEVLAERVGVVDDPAAELRAASRYLEGLAGPLRQRDLLHGLVASLMRLPLATRLLRWRAARERRGHPLQELLQSLDRS
ncbi:MAG: glycosyltransferase family 4 protein [Vicinamibacteraceae bacterium]